MAVVVEDGSGVANADSYFSIATADDYFLERNVTAWDDLSDPAKEAAARRGTEYLNETYADRWQGWRSTSSQALAWPRTGVYALEAGVYLAGDELPLALVRAAMEAALAASEGDLYAAPLPHEIVVEFEESVAGATTERTRYAEPKAGQSLKRRYDRIEALIRPLLTKTGFGSMMTRTVRV